MNKVFLVIISIAMVLIFSSFFLKTTGLFVNADVSIAEKLKGAITALNYKSTISITDFQNITVEFTNIGSLPMTAQIQETIYFYNNTRLNPVAYYYDSYVNLVPGMKRAFKTVFTPPYYGVYYIEARVPYETMVAESWGAFSVVYYVPTPPPIVIYVPPSNPGTITYVTNEVGTPGLSAEYQKDYNLNPGQSILIGVTAINTGEVWLNNLRFSLSGTDLITTDVNPKSLEMLSPNKSSIFLISLTVPNDTPAGVYPLDFEIVSDKATTSGTINLNVSSHEVSIKDEVYNTILNYEYFVDEIEKRMSDEVSEGLDVTAANTSFERAKAGLKEAKDYYDQGRYDDAKARLDEIKKDFEDTVFLLANAELNVQVAPAFSPFFIVIIAILLAVLFLFILRRRRKEKKPKLLSEAGEET